MKKIGIIGANGFIGKALTSYLLNNEYVVYAFIQRGTDLDNLKNNNLVIYEFDLNQLDNIIDFMPFDLDVVYYLAWQGVNARYKNDFHYQIENVKYMYNFMHIATLKRVRKIIVPGSISEFALGKTKIDGYNQPNPLDMYGAVKASARIICETYSKHHNLDINWVFIASIYGPGRNDNSLFPSTILKLLNKEKPLFTSLNQNYDFINLNDALKGLELIGQFGKKNTRYVLGSGKPTQIFKYINIIRDLIDSSLPLGVGEVDDLKYDTGDSILDISRAQNDVGFSPKVEFEDGIFDVIEYMKKVILESGK